jgi:hypothetical protein
MNAVPGEMGWPQETTELATLSTYLTPLNFHVWCYMRNMVYGCRVSRKKALLHGMFSAEIHMNGPNFSMQGSNHLEFQTSIQNPTKYI